MQLARVDREPVRRTPRAVAVGIGIAGIVMAGCADQPQVISRPPIVDIATHTPDSASTGKVRLPDHSANLSHLCDDPEREGFSVEVSRPFKAVVVASHEIERTDGGVDTFDLFAFDPNFSGMTGVEVTSVEGTDGVPQRINTAVIEPHNGVTFSLIRKASGRGPVYDVSVTKDTVLFEADCDAALGEKKAPVDPRPSHPTRSIDSLNG